jgi:hypothetical protein
MQVAFAASALSILTAFASWAGELGSAVIERLGEVVPTPAPSPIPEEKIRLIASITVQNKPTGETSFTFEAADFGERENGQFRIIAIEQYSLVEPKPEALQLRDQIVEQLRALEKDLLSYVEIAGPPREPQKLYELGGAAGSRPYP